MKTIRKTTAALLAGIMALTSGVVGISGSAANHARVAVHDPSIVKLADGSYFIAGSHLAAASSPDLQSWSYAANSQLGTKNTTFFKDIYKDLAVPAAWSSPSNPNYDLSGNLWAPDILWNEQMGKWCMYLSVNGDSYKSSIVLCTADRIEGPYTYVDTIVYSGFDNSQTFHYSKTDVEKVLGKNPDISRYLTNGSWNAFYGTNAIDPAVFYDESGALWMVYGSWFGGLFMLELDEATGLRDYSVTYKTVENASDAYMGIKVAGGHWVSGEGPYIEYMEDPETGKGYYYLFVSYGCFNNDGGYNMRVFRSDYPAGPYVDQNGNSAVYTKGGNNIGGKVGMRLMSNYKWNCNDRPNKAQGHNSLLMDEDGKLFVIYHNKFDDNYGGHEVRVHQLLMSEDGWVNAAPYEYVVGQDVSAVGHTMEAVTGEYEFIFHQLNQKIVDDQRTNGNNAEVEYSQNIKLNADGTITGDIKGTWEMTKGSSDMRLTFDGVTYTGSFLVQADESRDMVQKMTFTASGNNTCVWGSKKDAYNFSEDLVNAAGGESKLVYAPQTAQAAGDYSRLSGTDLLSGVSYRITSKFSGMALDLEGGKTADGTNIQQWNVTGGSQQEWRICAVDAEYCKIVSLADESKCIADADGNAALQTYTGADNQLWKLVQDGAFYGIVSKADGKSGLDVFEWSEEAGGNIALWDFWGGGCQLWKLTPTCPEVTDGAYTVKNVNSSLFLTVDNDINAVQGIPHTWTLNRQENDRYRIQAENGKYLTVYENTAEDGLNIGLEEENGTAGQDFTLHCNADGSYALLTECSYGKSCADVFEISTQPNANICQWNYWGGDGQKFILEPAEAPQSVRGDVNADGALSVLDAVMLQKWLLGVGELTAPAAGELAEDGVLDAFDLAMMKKMLMK